MLSFYKKIMIGSITFSFLLVGASCSEDTDNSNDLQIQNEEDQFIHQQPEDVELTLAWPGSEGEFNERFKDPVENHFDHIQLTHIEAHPGNTEQLEELIVSQNLPDLWVTGSPGSTTAIFQKDLAYDLNKVFETVDFELSRLEDNIVEELRSRSNEFLGPESNILGALPLTRGLSALHYNKDIFDLFGVDYPKDHMTWAEVAELARQVSREHDGVLYHGLHAHFHSAFTQHGVDHQDENGNPHFQDEPAFGMTLELMDTLFNILGNYPERPGDMEHVFMDGVLAMHASYDQTSSYQNAHFNWDIVTYPSWEHMPGIGPTSSGEVIGITNTSESIEQSFQVIDFLLSDEYQTNFSAKGIASPLVNEDIHVVFGEEEPAYQNIHIESLFDITPQKKIT